MLVIDKIKSHLQKYKNYELVYGTCINKSFQLQVMKKIASFIQKS